MFDPTQITNPGLTLGVILVVLFIGLVIAIAVYIYTALAYIAIAKKLGMQKPWLAWIPVANLYLLAQMAQMPTWPVYLVIGTIVPFLNAFFAIAIGVFSFIWIWKILERVGRPGWWVLLSLIPFFGTIAFLILLGVTAWGKPTSSVPPTTPTVSV